MPERQSSDDQVEMGEKGWEDKLAVGEPAAGRSDEPRPSSGRAGRFEGEGRPAYRGRGGERGERGEREGSRRPGDRRMRRAKRRVCSFCVDKISHIDYKDHARLREFTSDRGKIMKSRTTGTCARHQRALSQAIKRARQIALLPFVAE